MGAPVARPADRYDRGSLPGRAEAPAWLEERLADLDDPLDVLDLPGAMLLADVEVMPGRVVAAVVRELDRLGEVVDGRENVNADPATRRSVPYRLRLPRHPARRRVTKLITACTRRIKRT